MSNPRTSVVCFFLLLLYCLAEQYSTSPPLAENIASVTSSPPCVNACIPVPSLLAIHTILSQKLFLKCLMNTIFFPSGEYRGLENIPSPGFRISLGDWPSAFISNTVVAPSWVLNNNTFRSSGEMSRLSIWSPTRLSFGRRSPHPTRTATIKKYAAFIQRSIYYFQ